MTQSQEYPSEAAADQLDATVIVKQLATVQDTKAILEEREKELKGTLRTLLGEGKHQVAGLAVNITANRRFDPSAAAAVYPADSYPEMYTLALDAKKARNFISPADYDALMLTVGDPRVSLK